MSNIVPFHPRPTKRVLPLESRVLKFEPRKEYYFEERYPAHFNPMWAAFAGVWFSLAFLTLAMGRR
jgi:hypothetical protein